MGTDSEVEEDEPGQKKGSAVQGFLPGAPQTYHTTKPTRGRMQYTVTRVRPASPHDPTAPPPIQHIPGSITPGQSKFDATRRAQEEDTGIYALDNVGLFSGLTKAALAVGSVGMLTVPGMLATGAAYAADQVTGQDRFFNKALAPDRRSVNMEARSWTSPPESGGGGSGAGGRRLTAGGALGGDDEGRDELAAAPTPRIPVIPSPTPVPPVERPDEERPRTGRRVAGRRSLFSPGNVGPGYPYA